MHVARHRSSSVISISLDNPVKVMWLGGSDPNVCYIILIIISLVSYCIVVSLINENVDKINLGEVPGTCILLMTYILNVVSHNQVANMYILRGFPLSLLCSIYQVCSVYMGVYRYAGWV